MSSREWIDAREPVWRDALRGVSLIAEFDIDDDELERAERIFGGTLSLSDPGAVGRRYPAFFAICLTSAGARSWQESTFYAKVAEQLRVSTAKLTQATREYQSCLSRLGLPTFSEAEGMRWVTPVLLHGAVPLDHLDELLELMLRRRKRDTAMTGETFVEWARLSSAALVDEPKALTRFLKYGGDFAPDYVERVIDLIDGSENRLPRRAASRLADLLAEMPQLRAMPARNAATIRPSVALSADGSVIVHLPPAVPVEGRSVEWRVSSGGSTQVVEASVPFVEGRTTTDGHILDIGAPVREVLVERAGSSTTIPLVRSDDPLLVFDSRQRLVPPTSAIPAGSVIVMWAQALGTPRTLEGQDLVGDERDVPFGWDGWRSLSARLAPGSGIRLRGGRARRVAGDDKARIELGDALEGISTRDHQSVYSARPRLVVPRTGVDDAWTVVVSDASGAEIERLTTDGATIAVPTKPTPVIGDYLIEVRGPLGKGVKQRVAIIEDAAVAYRPRRRTFENRGGLTPATGRIARGLETLASTTLRPDETSRHVIVEGVPFLVEPPHIAVSVVLDGRAERWETDRLQLVPDDLTSFELGVRGLDPSVSHRLVLKSAAMTQIVPPRNGTRTFATFPLAGLTDHVVQAGAGTLWLGPDPLVPIAELRPPQLSRSATIRGNTIAVDGLAGAELEVAVYRLVAPWEAGSVQPLDQGRAVLGDAMLTSGPLRVEVRVANEWAPEPADVLPSLGADVYDLDLPWDPLSAESEVRAISGVLAGANELTLDGDTSVTSLARAIQVSGTSSIRRHVRNERRSDVDAMVRRGGVRSLVAVLETVASESAVVQALVRAGLASTPVSELSRPDLAEQLMQRSPLAGILAASADLCDEEQRLGGLGPAIVEALGSEIEPLWGGDLQPGAQLCRFETYFLKSPHLLKVLYSQLAPVPALLLDEDSATVAAYELWEARVDLARTAKRAMAVVADCRNHLLTTRPRLLPLVDARLTQDGVLALPVASVALALIARLAAHGDTSAAMLSARHREHHIALAQHAPHITTFDLVRADAAVTGSNA
ncbi:hypothetical protein [Isoptericola sp. NPDC019571]|uniref:hypothetical protein n=1 Tax=Isoptericola sp. NPDC019571 TaxID=3364008 RepID=UPI0037B96150